MISSIGNLVYELSQVLPNDLRLRILGNKEILGKSQIWVETYPSPQSLFHILNFGETSNLSCPVQFYWISLFCSKYLVQDYKLGVAEGDWRGLYFCICKRQVWVSLYYQYAKKIIMIFVGYFFSLCMPNDWDDPFN